jgi:hypothetical protein
MFDLRESELLCQVQCLSFAVDPVLLFLSADPFEIVLSAMDRSEVDRRGSDPYLVQVMSARGLVRMGFDPWMIEQVLESWSRDRCWFSAEDPLWMFQPFEIASFGLVPDRRVFGLFQSVFGLQVFDPFQSVFDLWTSGSVGWALDQSEFDLQEFVRLVTEPESEPESEQESVTLHRWWLYSCSTGRSSWVAEIVADPDRSAAVTFREEPEMMDLGLLVFDLDPDLAAVAALAQFPFQWREQEYSLFRLAWMVLFRLEFAPVLWAAFLPAML